MKVEKRVEDFNKELGELLAKYNLAMTTQSFITQDGRVASRLQLLDGEELKKAKEEAEKQENKEELIKPE